ncbi:hypothetical protein AMATHDRAFT_88396 [Amanita thiersii Skay4041]|uniref:Uncharacterized protein n=1 Tax=Amanita thiersii Skay4041 TaxID=703135 RepID=A0A2A9NEV9_9AGAR|nr:hypothetical protein AMATHDRAFT_88396 [Amanita thiersii Skay4041]
MSLLSRHVNLSKLALNIAQRKPLIYSSRSYHLLRAISAGSLAQYPKEQILSRIDLNAKPYFSSGMRLLSSASVQVSARQRLEEEGLATTLDQNQVQQIIEHAIKVWPAPSRIPPGWSSSWEHWIYLLTFYWFSPYFLTIPQIEMIVNIQYRLAGETRPLLFSNSKAQFIFTLIEDPTRFFLYDTNDQALYEFENVWSEEDLVTQMVNDPEALPLRQMVPDPEGEDAIRRILDRDETVVSVLAEKFLGYAPQVTEPWEETPSASEMLPDEDRDEIHRIVARKLEKLTTADGNVPQLTNDKLSKMVGEMQEEFEAARERRVVGEKL